MRVEGSAWGFNFETKRVQDKKNRYVEDDSEIKHDNAAQKWQGEAKQKSFNLRSFFFLEL